MNLFPEHKGSLKLYTFLFLLFGLILLICGTMFENKNSQLGKHQETVYRQDQVHYWAGIPFIVLGIASALFIILEVNCLLKFCICLDFICMNIAIFVIIVEGPDWAKYRAKANYYDDSGDIDYKMLKPIFDFGSYSPLGKSHYTSAMYYSGVWVFVAICSILLAVETFLVYLKVYCGIESIYAYLSGYEIINPEISIKMARPIEKFECKGCQTKPPTPTTTSSKPLTPITEKLPRIPISPPTSIRALMQPTVPDGKSERSVSPAPSDVSNASNAFYVCQEADGIKLVGYKPRRRDPHAPQLCTHHEEEEGPTDHYHFSRKHPNKYEDPNSMLSDIQVNPSFPKLPPLSLMDSPNVNSGKLDSPREFNRPNFDRRLSGVQSPLMSPAIPSPPVLPPIPPQKRSGGSKDEPGVPLMDRSPGKYPVEDIFPPPPSSLYLPRPSREKGRVSFMDSSSQPGTPVAVGTMSSSNPKLDTLI